MKYIKTYEKYNSVDNFKKYIIWQAKKILMILQVTEVTEYHLKFNKIYTLDKNDLLKKMKNEKIVIYHDYDKIKRHIIYEDDNLQECIDKLKIITDINKYNI
jgi:hypothetical protein